jgi:small GTP-binding protein
MANLKIVVLGPTGVGKTCVINRLCNETFIESTLPTIGAGFFEYVMVLDEDQINIMLWDTAGDERFRSVTPILLHGANALMLVYDVTRGDTFQEIPFYLSMFMDSVHVNNGGVLPVLLLGNKIDCDYDTVPESHVRSWMMEKNVSFFRLVSAKTGIGLNDLFQEFIPHVLAQNDDPSISLPLPNHAVKKSPECAC